MHIILILAVLSTMFTLVGCNVREDSHDQDSIHENAALHYIRALERTMEIHKTPAVADWDKVPITEEIIAISERYQPALDHLTEGARIKECNWTDYPRFFVPPDIGAVRLLITVVSFRARILHETGNSDRARGLLDDGLSFLRHYEAEGSYIAILTAQGCRQQFIRLIKILSATEKRD